MSLFLVFLVVGHFDEGSVEKKSMFQFVAKFLLSRNN